ncbi:MAG: hypothetical protein OHK0012_19290 [Synechococcales cyanobacterium]
MIQSPPSLRPLLERLRSTLPHPDLVPPLLAVGQDQSSLPPTQMQLAVAYTGSQRSQQALDLTLCLAHQTRLATGRTVQVHILHVAHPEHLEQSIGVMTQALTLAQEWCGTVQIHRRVGNVATELGDLLEQTAVHLLVVGCHSAHHPLIRQLHPYRCPILGIPELP